MATTICRDCASVLSAGDAFCVACGSSRAPQTTREPITIVARPYTPTASPPAPAQSGPPPPPPTPGAFAQQQVAGTSDPWTQRSWFAKPNTREASGHVETSTPGLQSSPDVQQSAGIHAVRSGADRITKRVVPGIRAQTQDRPSEAVLGLVTSLISLLPLMTPLVILAFFFAAKAKRQIASSATPLRGSDMVRYTRVICAISLLIPLTVILVNLIVFGNSLARLFNQISSTLESIG